MYKVDFITGSRAEYGIMRRYLKLLNEDPNIDLGIIVTGSLLDEKYGRQVSLIYEDGFKIDTEIKTTIDSTSNQMVLNNMAETLSKFGKHFNNSKYDLLIILGDRYEMLSVAIAAAMQKIPILHIHGGEATFGNYDEFIRHSITKMSLYHFTATEEYRKRVIQLGENPDNVFSLGALGAENCLFIDQKNVPEKIKKLPRKEYFIILFHPETLTNVSVRNQIDILLETISNYSKYKFIFLGSNADTNSDIIRNRVEEYVNHHENSMYFENLHTDAYHYLLKNGICIIGNSSSGIIEAPSLGIYSINIGNRQAGRVKGNSVIDTECNQKGIASAIEKVLKECKNIKPQNPYYKENTANLYFEKTKEILKRINNDIKKTKTFYDIM